MGANGERENTPTTVNRDLGRRLGIGLTVGVVLVAFLALMAYGLATREPLTAESGRERPGKPAPAFALESFDGRMVRLSDFQGQPVVLNFWASWCVPCRVEMPLLIDAFADYKEQGVVFIGIDVQDTREDAERFLAEFQVPVGEGYLILADPKAEAMIDYGVSGLPATFFIDRDGQVRKRWVGAVTRSIIDEQLAAILAG